MSYKIIVSRYNENIEWLEKEYENCIIYNKGIPLNINNEIILNNVGKESETYLNYIIKNYNNLPDVIVFTQARISDHRGSDDINYLINLKNEALINDKSNVTTIHSQYQGNEWWWEPEWNLRDGEYYLKNNYKNNNYITFIDWFKKNINSEYPNPIHIYANGIFAIKKELIIMNSKNYYKKLRLQINHHIDPAEGHFFERSWYYIFNSHIKKN